MASILQRYFAGDKSLIAEIEANGESNHAVAEIARGSLDLVCVEDRAFVDRKRKLELDQMELDVEQKRAEHELQMQHTKAEHELHMQRKKVELVMFTSSTIQKRLHALAKDETLDEETKFTMMGMIKTDLLKPSPCVKQEVPMDGPIPPDIPISISSVASDLGMRLSQGELVDVGYTVARAYRAKYGQKPPKHDQVCGGALRKVNSYTQRDRAIVEAALRD